MWTVLGKMSRISPEVERRYATPKSEKGWIFKIDFLKYPKTTISEVYFPKISTPNSLSKYLKSSHEKHWENVKRDLVGSARFGFLLTSRLRSFIKSVVEELQTRSIP